MHRRATKTAAAHATACSKQTAGARMRERATKTAAAHATAFSKQTAGARMRERTARGQVEESHGEAEDARPTRQHRAKTV